MPSRGALSGPVRRVDGSRACILNSHNSYSLRRHYPVTGSAVDAAMSVVGVLAAASRPPRRSAPSQPGAPSSRVCKGAPTLASPLAC
ncbi:hypothetical protein SSCG_04101 [Streptomyces clavuligerus]|nr:hypothetical protein SSCG_04101 [Streptomyces clavuligerus]